MRKLLFLIIPFILFGCDYPRYGKIVSINLVPGKYSISNYEDYDEYTETSSDGTKTSHSVYKGTWFKEYYQYKYYEITTIGFNKKEKKIKEEFNIRRLDTNMVVGNTLELRDEKGKSIISQWSIYEGIINTGRETYIRLKPFDFFGDEYSIRDEFERDIKIEWEKQRTNDHFEED